MLTTLDSIATRRSIKQYDPAFQLPESDLQRLFEAAQQTPTAFNIQHWRIVRVTDPDQRRHLREAAWDQSQVTDASELWVLCADLKAWEKSPKRYWRNADANKQTVLVNMMDDFYRGKAQVERDEAIRSCGMLAQTLMLAATAMGYQSCPMIGFDMEGVSRLIRLPADHVIGLLLAIGRGTAPAYPRGGTLPLDEVVLDNSFPL